MSGHTSAAAQSADWGALKAAVTELRALQAADGSIADAADRGHAGDLVDVIVARIAALAPLFAHDAEYLAALPRDFGRWVEGGFGKPPVRRVAGRLPARPGSGSTVPSISWSSRCTPRNGNAGKVFEAVLLSVVWPKWLADVEQRFDNGKFLAVAFEDFTAGYDTDSAVLFPETVTVEKTPEFHWGAIFCDREAARFRRVTARRARCSRCSSHPTVSVWSPHRPCPSPPSPCGT